MFSIGIGPDLDVGLPLVLYYSFMLLFFYCAIEKFQESN